MVQRTEKGVRRREQMVQRTEKGVRRREQMVRRTEKGVRRTEKWVRRTEIVLWGHRSHPHQLVTFRLVAVKLYKFGFKIVYFIYF